jgi:hypothetical protein
LNAHWATSQLVINFCRAVLAFLRGDLPQARTYLTDDLEVVTRIKAQGERGFATIIMAHITCVEENYQRAQQLAEEALALVKPHVARERLIASRRAMVACGLGEYDQAGQQIHTVFEQETRPGIRLLTLPMYALFQAHDLNFAQIGDKSSKERTKGDNSWSKLKEETVCRRELSP